MNVDNLTVEEPRVLHLTHADLDAAMCDIQLRLIYNNIKTKRLHPDTIYRELNKLNIADWDILYITDLRLANARDIKKLEAKITSQGNSVKVQHIDHHEDNTDYLKTKEWSYVRESINERKTCASELLFYKLQDILKKKDVDLKSLKKIVSLTRAQDVWDNTNKDIFKESQILNHIFVDKRFETFVGDILLRLTKRQPIMTEDEKLVSSRLLESELRYSQKVLNNIVKVKFENFTLALCVSGALYSIIPHMILDNNEDVDIACVTNLDKVSLRSRSDAVNVAAIAKIFGGNGHKVAAAFKIKNSKKILESIFSLIFSTKAYERK